MKTSCLLGPLLWSALAGARITSTAKVLDPGPRHEGTLFTFSEDVAESDGGQVVTITYKDPKDQTVVVENAQLNKSGSIESYQLDQRQLGAIGSAEVKNDRVYFKYTSNGKTKTEDEKIKGNFLVVPMIIRFIGQHWPEIQDGKTVASRLAVLDRLETVGFNFFKEKETEVKGQKVVVVKMKPTSFVIAALVDPLHFYMTLDGKSVVQIDGRAVVKRSVDGKYKDLDTLTVYDLSTTAQRE